MSTWSRLAFDESSFFELLSFSFDNAFWKAESDKFYFLKLTFPFCCEWRAANLSALFWISLIKFVSTWPSKLISWLHEIRLLFFEWLVFLKCKLKQFSGSKLDNSWEVMLLAESKSSFCNLLQAEDLIPLIK